MARPSLKEERTEEILRAYEHCIGLYGVEGTTSKKVAEIAGIARPLVRHHVGNNDELFAKLLDRFMQRTKDDIEKFMKLKIDNVDDLIDVLFDSKNVLESEHGGKDIIIATALMSRAYQDESLRIVLEEWFKGLNDFMINLFGSFFPNAEKQDIKNISAAIFSYYMTSDNLSLLGDFSEQSNCHLNLIKEFLYKLDETNKK